MMARAVQRRRWGMQLYDVSGSRGAETNLLRDSKLGHVLWSLSHNCSGFSFLQTEVCELTHNLRFLVPAKQQTASQTYRLTLLSIKLTPGWVWSVTVRGHGVILSFICRFQINFLTCSSSLCYNVWCLHVYKSASASLKFQISMFTVAPRIRVLINFYEEEGGTNWESMIDTDTRPCVKWTAGGKMPSGPGSAARFSMLTRGWDGAVCGEGRFTRKGTHTYSQLVHAVVQQKLTASLSHHPPIKTQLVNLKNKLPDLVQTGYNHILRNGQLKSFKP